MVFVRLKLHKINLLLVAGVGLAVQIPGIDIVGRVGVARCDSLGRHDEFGTRTEQRRAKVDVVEQLGRGRPAGEVFHSVVDLKSRGVGPQANRRGESQMIEEKAGLVDDAGQRELGSLVVEGQFDLVCRSIGNATMQRMLEAPLFVEVGCAVTGETTPHEPLVETVEPTETARLSNGNEPGMDGSLNGRIPTESDVATMNVGDAHAARWDDVYGSDMIAQLDHKDAVANSSLQVVRFAAKVSMGLDLRGVAADYALLGIEQGPNLESFGHVPTPRFANGRVN